MSVTTNVTSALGVDTPPLLLLEPSSEKMVLIPQ